MLDKYIEWEKVESIKSVGLRNNNPNYFKKILDLYEDQSTKMLAEAHVAIQTENYGSLAHIAHSLKGSSLCLGANHLADACHKMESAVRQGLLDKDNAKNYISDVETAFKKSLHILKSAN